MEDDAKTEVLLKQFESVFSTPGHTAEDIQNFIEEGEEFGVMEDINFTIEDIKKSVKEMKNTSAPGPDGLPVILLRECIEELAAPLHTLWLNSLRSRKIASKLNSGI